MIRVNDTVNRNCRAVDVRTCAYTSPQAPCQQAASKGAAGTAAARPKSNTVRLSTAGHVTACTQLQSQLRSTPFSIALRQQRKPRSSEVKERLHSGQCRLLNPLQWDTGHNTLIMTAVTRSEPVAQSHPHTRTNNQTTALSYSLGLEGVAGHAMCSATKATQQHPSHKFAPQRRRGCHSCLHRQLPNY